MSEGPPPPRRRRDPITVATVIGFLGFLAVTLGPSLLGLRVFTGLDVLQRSLPFGRATPADAPVVSIFVRDIVDFYLPAFDEARRRITEGDWPSWSPYTAGGTPLGSIPSVPLLTPLSLPFLLLPTWLAVGYVQLLVVLTGSAGCYLFLRRLDSSRPAALLAGLVFSTSGYMVAWTNWPQLRVGAFVPVLFWALERFLQLRTLRSAVPIALAAAGLLLGGFPAVAGLAMYAGGAYMVVRLLADRAGRPWRRVLTDGATAGAAVVLGAGLTAVQLLPFASYLGTLDLSYRSQQFFNTTPPQYAATAVFPQAFFENVFGPGTPYAREVNPIEVNTHLGAVTLLLVLLAVLRAGQLPRPRGALTFLVLTAVLSGWLVFVQGPLVTWMAVLPIFDGNPIGRVRAILGLGIAALAGLGFDALVQVVRRTAESPRGRRSVVERVVVACAVTGLLILGWLVDRRQTPLLGGDVRREIVLTCVGTVLVAALILAGHRARRLAVAAAVVIPLVVTVQAVEATRNFWPTSPRAEYYPETAAHRFLIDHVGSERIAQTGEVLLPSTTGLYGLRLVGGHAFVEQRWSELLRGIAPDTFVAPTISTLATGDPALAEAPGLDRMAARYYVSADSAPIPGTVLATGPPDGTVGPAAAVTTQIPAQALRGVGFSLTGSSLSPAARVTVTLTDAVGETVAVGERPIPGARVPGDVFVPLAAEDAGARPGPLTVAIDLGDRLNDAPPAFVATAGAPRLLLVGPGEDQLRLVAVLDGVTIYERADALPRIRWAGRSEVIADTADRVAAVAGQALPADKVVLSAPGPEAGGGSADVQVLEDSGDTVRARVEAAGAGYLVLADPVQSDWAVTVDGAPAEIVAADHAFGAVFVEDGAHDVVFFYAPRGRTAGALISAVSAALLLAVAVLPGRRRRRHGRPLAAP